MTLKMRGIAKSFDTNLVLKSIDFTLESGQIQALLGENGAGKSTLMNILGGVLNADHGTITIDGKTVHFASPRDSIDAGIGFIHQELNLVNDLTVYENMFIGREITNGPFLNAKEMIRQCAEVFARMGVPLDPAAMVRDLDASYKQIVEIARALLMKARIIIMDEPTTSLTDVEIRRVFDMMRTLASQGVGIVFISHKLKEVLDICDSYTVLRDGEMVAQGPIEGVTTGDLARHMVGHDVRSENLQKNRALGAVVLSTENLTLPPHFRNISFDLRAGEIIGFTGLLGDGRSELFQAIFGLMPGYHGQIRIEGKETKMHNTHDALKLGIGYVPRNRKENGIIKDMTVLENASIVTIEQLSTMGLIDRKRETSQFDRQIKALGIRLSSALEPITSLSGGNQQKVVLSKWLDTNPKILIFDNPTQGVDVGAKEDIYDIILHLADQGVAIAILSSEAQEIIRLCDRAFVMYHGVIQGAVSRSEMTEHNIMLLATGGK